MAFAFPAFNFDQQRGTCLACAHCREVESTARNRTLKCSAPGAGRGGCSFLRAPGGKCGPEAKHFKAKEAADA